MPIFVYFITVLQFDVKNIIHQDVNLISSYLSTSGFDKLKA